MFSRAIAKMLPIIPKSIVKRVAKRYIAGVTLKEAMDKVLFLNNNGFSATIDILGEDVVERKEALKMKEDYLKLLDTISEKGLDSNVSIKLTNFGLKFDEQLTFSCVEEIALKAKKLNNFVRIDMEDSSVTTKTLEIYEYFLKKGYPVGIVLQAYLHRTEKDLDHLIKLNENYPVNIRICKGIYNEPKKIAYKSKKKIRENYLLLAKKMLNAGIYTGIATHDRFLINTLDSFVEEKKIPKNRFEFQALLGVPVTDLLKELVNRKNKVRIYVPYGENWYGYSVRRLKENPKMAGHIFWAIFKKSSYEQ